MRKRMRDVGVESVESESVVRGDNRNLFFFSGLRGGDEIGGEGELLARRRWNTGGESLVGTVREGEAMMDHPSKKSS